MTSRSKLIVLSGEAGAGKDSVAKLLTENYGWQLYSLAGPLKRFASDMFGFTDEQLYGPSSARNAPDPRWARPCPNCKATGFVSHSLGQLTLCPDCVEGKVDDNSPRRVLQLMGEEYLRQMIHVDALTMRAGPDIQALLDIGVKVVVNDARNDNDRNNLHNWLKACRVDVRSVRTKESKRGDSWRKHASELRLAKDDQLEYVVQNDEEWPFPALTGKVERMLLELFR